ncbi:hypothetical protein WH87_15470 [Devosia epidermidihirudinis]|uniref:HTH lysR-type domain-containing protein n=1 Tax=Devosia epidermidihirudinis TaxID=1293439 RepID=A0A0F5Q4Y8_9HYPH|nr:LysR family transcriptional regulator [Devosia epidermidihirudinis]KKC35955.1 hypothetical protein WH87_15470 [Devosia epidermidihirudinis]
MNGYSSKTNIGLRHFKAALAVADMRSFARAAEHLHVVPSALTETIRQLEAESGVQLFDRSARPVTLTPAGDELIVRARRIVADFDLAMLDLRRLGGLESGSIRVGAAPSMVGFPLSPAIRNLAAQHKGIDVTVFDDIAERLGTMVLDRVVDFALAERWHDTDELTYEPLLNDPFVLVCHKDHPLASRESVLLADIPEGDMMLLDDSTGTGKLIGRPGVLPERLRHSQMRAHSTISLLIMISEGMGLSLMPRLAASVLRSPNIALVALADLSLERQLCIVSRAHASTSPAVAALIGHIKACLQTLRD